MSIHRWFGALTVTLAAAALLGGAVHAQTLEVPALSTKAKVEHRIGLTDFAVDYSSPAVRGRKIFGALVPYDQLWRTGANAATKLTASREFTFGDKTVPAGTYSLVTIPGAGSWTVILNSETTVTGPGAYDQKKDAARITVKPESCDPRERMTFLFTDIADDGGRLDLEWDTVRVSIPLKVDTKTHVMAGIDKTLGDAWRPHFVAGRYLFDSNGDLDTALRYLDTSIEIKPTWWNNWIRAQVLAKKGRNADAVAAAEKARQLGKGDEVFEDNFKDTVEKALNDWKKGKS